jgi:predicted AlkP superfamily pyrophosphatase or phosphodiesterase
MKLKYISIGIILSLFFLSRAFTQNVIIVVLDGARYTETFGADSTYIRNMWTKLKPNGTIFTNYRNDGKTVTIPGHTAIETGTWQIIDNDGLERPTMPTIFECFRKATGVPESQNYIATGKKKLKVLSYSTHKHDGSAYKAAVSVADGDRAVMDSVFFHMNTDHPRLILINLPDIDAAAHDNNWKAYTTAITRADSLVYVLWQYIQSHSSYNGNTTLIVTNDHGRHDDAHGGFENHGCGCEGCRHIMLLMAGRNIPPGIVDSLKAEQIDIAPTVGELLAFPTPLAVGKSLLHGRISDKKTPASH